MKACPQWGSHYIDIDLSAQTKVLIFYCLATNDNKDLPCLRVMVYIHLNWCLEGCTEWRWMQSNLVQVLDRRIERERQAMFWHT